METIRVQVTFEEETSQGKFRDSLYYTLDEYQKLKDSEKEAHKKERIDKYVALVEQNSAIVPTPEPTLEEKEAAYNALSDEEKYLVDQKAKYIAMYGDIL